MFVKKWVESLSTPATNEHNGSGGGTNYGNLSFLLAHHHPVDRNGMLHVSNSSNLQKHCVGGIPYIHCGVAVSVVFHEHGLIVVWAFQLYFL